MSDDKTKPIDDLKQGLGLLFRAAKGVAEVAAEKIEATKLEDAARDAVREVGRALETVGGEIDKAWTKATGSAHPPPHDAPSGHHAPPGQHAAPPPDTQGSAVAPSPPPHDDAYAPGPAPNDTTPRGPRVG